VNRSRVVRGVIAATMLVALSAGSALADGLDPQTLVNPFRDTINTAKLTLLELNQKKGAQKTQGKREALELLSRAWIMLQRIPAAVQEAESLSEDRRFVENNLKDLGTDPRIRKIKDSTLLKGIQVYRAGNLSEALILFEELRMIDPTDPGVSFLVRHINRRLDDELD
jgi:membrane peptidoglycan carboxypeptidase